MENKNIVTTITIYLLSFIYVLLYNILTKISSNQPARKLIQTPNVQYFKAYDIFQDLRNVIKIFSSDIFVKIYVNF